MTYANHDVYDGDWKDDEPHGQGVMKYHNGDVYKGEFSGGKMHGKGIFEYAAGEVSKSVGQWKEGKKSGWFDEHVIVRACNQVYYDN